MKTGEKFLSVDQDVVNAAEHYVSKYINKGYENEFVVLDSRLMNVVVSEAEDEAVVSICYAYFKMKIDNIMQGNTGDYKLTCECVELYERDLLSSDLGFASNAMGIGNPCIDFWEYSPGNAENEYKDSVDPTFLMSSLRLKLEKELNFDEETLLQLFEGDSPHEETEILSEEPTGTDFVAPEDKIVATLNSDGSRHYILSNLEEHSMSSSWTVYMCCEKLDSGIQLSVRSYEILEPYDSFYDEEKDDYVLPDKINGKTVVGVEDHIVIGGDLEIVGAYGVSAISSDINSENIESFVNSTPFDWAVISAKLRQVAREIT